VNYFETSEYIYAYITVIDVIYFGVIKILILNAWPIIPNIRRRYCQCPGLIGIIDIIGNVLRIKYFAHTFTIII